MFWQGLLKPLSVQCWMAPGSLERVMTTTLQEIERPELPRHSIKQGIKVSEQWAYVPVISLLSLSSKSTFFFFFYLVILELDQVIIFYLSSGTILGFHNGGCWRDTAQHRWGRSFSFWFRHAFFLFLFSLLVWLLNSGQRPVGTHSPTSCCRNPAGCLLWTSSRSLSKLYR